jgi:hypothetical protein
MPKPRFDDFDDTVSQQFFRRPQQAETPVSICQWPECRSFAHTEVKEGLHADWLALCKPHRRAYTGHETHDWQPRRKRLIRDEAA